MVCFGWSYMFKMMFLKLKKRLLVAVFIWLACIVSVYKMNEQKVFTDVNKSVIESPYIDEIRSLVTKIHSRFLENKASPHLVDRLNELRELNYIFFTESRYAQVNKTPSLKEVFKHKWKEMLLQVLFISAILAIANRLIKNNRMHK